MEQNFIVAQGKVFDVIGVADAVIAQMDTKYLGLKIKGPEDKQGFEAVHAGRMLYKSTRCKVENEGLRLRKAAKLTIEDYLASEKKEESRILKLLEPGEVRLTEEEKGYTDAVEAIKQEKARIEELRIQGRRDRLAGLGVGFNGQMWSYGTLNLPEAMLKVASDEQFDLLFSKFQDAFNAEQMRIEAERERQKEENDRLAKIAAEQEAERQRFEIVAREQADKELKAQIRERMEAAQREQEAAALKAEEKRIADEKTEWERIKKAEQDAIGVAKQKAIDDAKNKEVMELWKTRQAETARIEAEAKIKRELDDKAEKERLARVAAEKKAARRPDKEKLRAYLVNVFGVESPEMKTAEGKAAWEEIDKGLEELNMRLGPIVEAL